jgi:hypothetical protein
MSHTPRDNNKYVRMSLTEHIQPESKVDLRVGVDLRREIKVQCSLKLQLSRFVGKNMLICKINGLVIHYVCLLAGWTCGAFYINMNSPLHVTHAFSNL